MLKVGKILVSDEAVTASFSCDLGACHGDCCRVGDAGSPLADGERRKIEAALPEVLLELPEENRDFIASKGWLDPASPRKDQLNCFPDGRCAFSIPRPGGVLGCAIEAAHLKGNTSFRKPIFCHLFPLRVTSFYGQTLINVERRPECKPGWRPGTGLLEFSRAVLERLFGAAWYKRLMKAVEEERTRSRQARSGSVSQG